MTSQQDNPSKLPVEQPLILPPLEQAGRGSRKRGSRKRKANDPTPQLDGPGPKQRAPYTHHVYTEDQQREMGFWVDASTVPNLLNRRDMARRFGETCNPAKITSFIRERLKSAPQIIIQPRNAPVNRRTTNQAPGPVPVPGIQHGQPTNQAPGPVPVPGIQHGQPLASSSVQAINVAPVEDVGPPEAAKNETVSTHPNVVAAKTNLELTQNHMLQYITKMQHFQARVSLVTSQLRNLRVAEQSLTQESLTKLTAMQANITQRKQIIDKELVKYEHLVQEIQSEFGLSSPESNENDNMTNPAPHL